MGIIGNGCVREIGQKEYPDMPDLVIDEELKRLTDVPILVSGEADNLIETVVNSMRLAFSIALATSLTDSRLHKTFFLYLR